MNSFRPESTQIVNRTQRALTCPHGDTVNTSHAFSPLPLSGAMSRCILNTQTHRSIRTQTSLTGSICPKSMWREKTKEKQCSRVTSANHCHSARYSALVLIQEVFRKAVLEKFSFSSPSSEQEWIVVERKRRPLERLRRESERERVCSRRKTESSPREWAASDGSRLRGSFAEVRPGRRRGRTSRGAVSFFSSLSGV